MMRIYTIAVFLFLYVPIGIIVLFSFNAGRHASELRGLSVQWYGKALSNPFVMDAFTTSLIVAFSVAILSSLMGDVTGEKMTELSIMTIRSIVKGVLGIAIIQAVAALIGLLIADIPARALTASSASWAVE